MFGLLLVYPNVFLFLCKKGIFTLATKKSFQKCKICSELNLQSGKFGDIPNIVAEVIFINIDTGNIRKTCGNKHPSFI